MFGRRGVLTAAVAVLLLLPATAAATRQAWRIQDVSVVGTLHAVATDPPTCAAAMNPPPNQALPPDKSIIAGDYVVALRAVGDNRSQAVQYNGFYGPNSQQPLRFRTMLRSTTTETYRDLVQTTDDAGNTTCNQVDRKCQTTTNEPGSTFLSVQTTGNRFDATHLARNVGVDWSSAVNTMAFRSCRSFAYGGPLAPDLSTIFKAPILGVSPVTAFFRPRQRLHLQVSRSVDGRASANTYFPPITGQVSYRGDVRLRKSTLPYSCKDHITHSGFVCTLR